MMISLTGKPAIEFDLNDVQGKSHDIQSDGVHWLLLIFHRHLG